MKWLFSSAEPFIWHPLRAFGVALAILVLYVVARAVQARRPGSSARPLLIAAAAWAIFGGLEAEATREKADIRVDLLLTWPALWAVSAGCLALWLWRLFAPRASSPRTEREH